MNNTEFIGREFKSVTFEGILTVTDAARFRETLTQGLGRGKAYGNGLMTVVGIGEGVNG